MVGYQSEVEIISAQELGAGHRRERLFIVSYPDGKLRNIPRSWTEQVREVVERERLNTSWLTIRDISNGIYHEVSVRLVQGLEETHLEPCHYTRPTKAPGRIKARKLAGKTVTPAQAAICNRASLVP